MKAIIPISATLLLFGCVIGNGRICGPQTPLANCDKEAYEKLTNPGTFIEKLEKPGASSEDRDQDSADCGGGQGRYAPTFSRQRIEAEQRPGDKEMDAYGRLHDNWARCMLKKGYRYTGDCPPVPRTPACGAP